MYTKESLSKSVDFCVVILILNKEEKQQHFPTYYALLFEEM